MKRIFIVLLNVIIIFTLISLNFNISFAGEGSISAPSSVTVGNSFTVTVNIPSDAVGYQGEIIVKFSDGTTQNSGNLTVVTGITGDYAHPGNMSYNFLAVSEGTATITVSNLKITDRNANRINTQTTLSGSISVVKKEETPVTPEVPTTPSPSTTTETPSTTMPNITSDEPSSTQTNITELQETTTNTTPEEPSWTETGDKVYATTSMNVRSGWATSYSLVGGLKKGDSVTRISVGSNGWDKIKYNGKTAYVFSRLLTTEKVEPDIEEENTVVENKVDENTVSNEIANKTVSKNVTANMTETEIDEYNKLIEEVGVLPTVGKSYADYIYFVAVFGAIVMVGIVGKKSRKVEKWRKKEWHKF